ncbi:hypothetical protein [Nitrosomonas sp.]|uniref:hypothetical protein n=1 Tax=Nitrosomonas sp. TaxID=42353 RepID=UPI0025DC72B3|nr:hypothetical protein [Nitrosomonas sp.]
MQANNPEKPIFPESEEAAKFVTGISGWVDRDGRFWGADEKMARYSGSTHRHCDCGEVVEQRSYCRACSRRKDIEKYKNAQKIEWDHKTPLYSQDHDKYLFDKDDLFDLMCETQVTDPDELELFICEPNELSQINSEYWNDDLPEDGELPDSVEEALAVFNKALVDAGTVSWHPGKFAAIVDLEAKHD